MNGRTERPARLSRSQRTRGDGLRTFSEPCRTSIQAGMRRDGGWRSMGGSLASRLGLAPCARLRRYRGDMSSFDRTLRPCARLHRRFDIAGASFSTNPAKGGASAAFAGWLQRVFPPARREGLPHRRECAAWPLRRVTKPPRLAEKRGGAKRCGLSRDPESD